MQCACAPYDDDLGLLENEVVQLGDAPLRSSWCCEPPQRPVAPLAQSLPAVEEPATAPASPVLSDNRPATKEVPLIAEPEMQSMETEEEGAPDREVVIALDYAALIRRQSWTHHALHTTCA